MSDCNNEDEDFIIPPYLFRNDEEIDGISDSDSLSRYQYIPTISLNSSFNTDSDFSNTSQSTISSPESPSITNDLLFESLINMRPPLVDGEIPSSFIELRNNIINTQLNQGNIRLHSSVISDLGGTRENLSPVADLPYFYIGGIKVQWNRPRRTNRAGCSRRIFSTDSPETPELARRLGARTARSVRFLDPPIRSASQSWQRPGSSRRNIQYPYSRGDNPAHRASGDRPSSWDTISTQLSNMAMADPLGQGPDIIETGNVAGPSRNLQLGRLNWIEDNVEDIFSYLISVEPPSSPESTPAPSNSLQNVTDYNQANSGIIEPLVLNVQPPDEETLPDDLTSFIADILSDLITMTLENIPSDSGPTEPTE